MSMRIVADRCAGCGLCAEVCALSAVRRSGPLKGPPSYDIDPERCTECVGHFDRPRCAAVCRLNAISLDAERFESRATLMRKWHRLAGGNDYAQEVPPALESVGEYGDSDA